MNNRRSILILGILFVGLLGVILLQGRGFTGPISPTLEPTPRPMSEVLRLLPPAIPGLSASEIQAVRLSTPDESETLLLQRDDNNGWTTPDFEQDVDAATADLIAETLTLLPYLDTVRTDEQTDLSQYGFVQSNPLAMVISVEMADETAHRIFIGGRTAAQDGFYAIVDERAGFYVLEARAVEFLRFQLRNLPGRLTS